MSSPQIKHVSIYIKQLKDLNNELTRRINSLELELENLTPEERKQTFVIRKGNRDVTCRFFTVQEFEKYQEDNPDIKEHTFTAPDGSEVTLKFLTDEELEMYQDDDSED